MNTDGGGTDILRAEAAASSGMKTAEYERAVCAMIDRLQAGPALADLLDLADAVLRRGDSALVEARACIAERLLSLLLTSSVPDPRARHLFDKAWQQLCAIAAGEPDSVPSSPDLPPGIVLPSGADPAAIRDPALRAQAREAATRHAEIVERWNAKQRAAAHLQHLAAILWRVPPDESTERTTALAAAMAEAQGLPAALRKMLAERSASSP